MTDLICRGSSPYEKLFSPARIKPAAGFAAIVKEALDVTAMLVSKKFFIDTIDGAVDLAPEEAKVVHYEGHTIAMYKNADGKLFAVNPSCPHIKCTVGWNSAEKSWDCPCHGSRFSFTGEFMTAPARKDLEVIELIKKTQDIK